MFFKLFIYKVKLLKYKILQGYFNSGKIINHENTMFREHNPPATLILYTYTQYVNWKGRRGKEYQNLFLR